MKFIALVLLVAGVATYAIGVDRRKTDGVPIALGGGLLVVAAFVIMLFMWLFGS